ncbi:MAG: hypothetical protein GY906_07860 [bacterium]|nr:hypothetical protein [bacterium]
MLRRIIRMGDAAGFIIACSLAYILDWSAPDLVWGLLISSMVGGSLALMLPLWTLLLFPSLEQALFPDLAKPNLSPMGRVAACFFFTMAFLGPFLFSMLIFVGFLVERVPIEGMPPKDALWISHAVWAFFAYLPMVLVVTISKVLESALRIWRGDASVVLRPFALLVKMLIFVVLSNFGIAQWMIVPLIALIYLPEDTILYWIGRKEYEQINE